MRFSLPAVPTPEAVKMPLNASAPIFEHAEAIYKLPQVDDQIFGSEGLNIKHFLRAWIHLNKQNIDVVQVDLLKAALENFARQGFPGFPGLVTSLIEQVLSLQQGILSVPTDSNRISSSIIQTRER